MGVKEDEWKRGTKVCENCCYYKESELTPAMRCVHKTNVREDTYGTTYSKAPDYKNWDWNCKHFRKKRTPSRGARKADKRVSKKEKD